MTGWRALGEELDRWGDSGSQATLWWRDDDAIKPSAPLDRLLSLSEATNIPLSLAVIPGQATEGLADAIAGISGLTVIQHGWRHENHQPEGAKAELGDARPAEAVTKALGCGRDRLSALFSGALPILVPPWNRIAPALTPLLAGLGFTGLSCFRPRTGQFAADGVRAVNTHVDIIDWRGHRGFIGEDAALDSVVSHLAGRRTGACDRCEPTGILTHHLVHDRECWSFLDRLMRRTAGHPAAQWLGTGAAFAGAAR